MAADFYRSSHANNWLVDRRTLTNARALDLRYATPQEIAWIAIFSANLIQKIGKRLSLRQQVVATAIVFLRRFYLKNSYCETDLPLVAAACVYVAAKAEETAIHIKVVVNEARATFTEYGIVNFPTDSSKLAEMEFYLIEDLEFHLIVYHPYRSLVHMTGRDSGPVAARKTTLDMDDNSMQMAWFVLNDTYRSELCLLYPPHLIATASIYLAFSLHFPPNLLGNAKTQPGPKSATGNVTSRNAETGEPDAKRARGSSFSAGQPGSSSNALSAPTGLTPNTIPASMPSSPLSGDPPSSVPKQPLSTAPRGTTDPITFLASLNVQLPLVLEIVQEVLSLYACWKAYEEPPNTSAPGTSTAQTGGSQQKDTPSGQSTPVSAIPMQSPTRMMQALTPTVGGSFPGMGGRGPGGPQPGTGDDRAIQILNRMRMNRDMDLAHPANAGANSNAKPRT
ncbi:cyclin-like protein [Cystobasidium minutum MCA 4210]|uniref:cyclin-like protein n=1 Tax=Cystobasidium minutum MCA 4210 TaxID=1397322 RepID=UPI0034CD858F|eukprot:jgi/Rhomi1/57908/CE57907_430